MLRQEKRRESDINDQHRNPNHETRGHGVTSTRFIIKDRRWLRYCYHITSNLTNSDSEVLLAFSAEAT